MKDSAAIRLEIEATRKRIAETAEALAYRADVKARVSEDVALRVANARAAARAGVTRLAKSFSGNGAPRETNGSHSEPAALVSELPTEPLAPPPPLALPAEPAVIVESAPVAALPEPAFEETPFTEPAVGVVRFADLPAAAYPVSDVPEEEPLPAAPPPPGAPFPIRNLLILAAASFAGVFLVLLLLGGRERDESQDRDVA